MLNDGKNNVTSISPVVVVLIVVWQVHIINNWKKKDKSNGTEGMEHSPGHIFSFFSIKGVSHQLRSMLKRVEAAEMQLKRCLRSS